jgi:hypothetical protein
MRSRFAMALAAAFCLASSAGALDRNELHSGDSALGDISEPGTYDEFTIRAARGSSMTISIAKSGGGAFVPAIGVYNDNYQGVPVAPISATSVRGDGLPSGQYRILVGGQRYTVGAYRVKTTLQPAKTFLAAGTGASPVASTTFGAYEGFDATITIKWKGPAPVTLTSVIGPDGAALTSSAAPKTTASTFQQGGWRATALGDHVVNLAVPEGTVKWTVTVKVAGKLPAGRSFDFRATTPPDVPGVEFPSFGRSPIVTIPGERGGPNEILLFATGGLPDATFIDFGAGAGGCSRAARDTASPPTKYLLYCLDGFFAEIENVVRDDAGLVTSYDAPSMRTPWGSGSATLTDITRDAAGRTTGWTEVRRFDATGRSYELVFSDAQYLPGGACKAFRVKERLLPDGVPRTYDYAPVR